MIKQSALMQTNSLDKTSSVDTAVLNK